jgi:putative ABC transport system permease protein
VQRQYETEVTLGRIISSFTLMAIVISCLGLFGLLSQDFLKLVVFSLLIATPVAWWAAYKWLQSFTYQVPLSWWMFGLAGLLAVVIALVTVSFQAVRATQANPVKSLRSAE